MPCLSAIGNGILYVCAIQRHRREFTASTYPLLIRQHEDFGKEIGKEYNIVTEAIFGPNEGGILVIKEDLPSDAFSSDPGVEQGLIDAQIKKLYIARTSFCER